MNEQVVSWAWCLVASPECNFQRRKLVTKKGHGLSRWVTNGSLGKGEVYIGEVETLRIVILKSIKTYEFYL